MNLQTIVFCPANGTQREIKVKRQRLGKLCFKYLGAVVSHHSFKPEVISKIAQATAAPTKWKPMWRDNNIHLPVRSKVKLKHFLVIFNFICLCIRDLYSRGVRKFEMLLEATEHFIQRL